MRSRAPAPAKVPSSLIAATMRRSSQFMGVVYHGARLACNIAAMGCKLPAWKQELPRFILAANARETIMLQLYFYPMACSLASRIALMEAGIEARYHLVNIWDKKVIEDGGDFRAVSPKGAVPVLVKENGERLTESAAVLQYIADLKPELGLAPPPGDADRYRLQEWLSFVGCEIHKAFLFPTFWYKDDAAKAAGRERIGKSVSVAADHLAERVLSRRRSLHRRRRLSHLVAAAAQARRRRRRHLAVTGRLSRTHARAPAVEGRDRSRDEFVEEDGGLDQSTLASTASLRMPLLW